MSALLIMSNRWVQLQLFIALNFVSFAYSLVVKPFSSLMLNKLNAFNEMCALLIAYILLEQ